MPFLSKSWLIPRTKFAMEICCFHRYRGFDDGISFVEFNLSLDLYRADHHPRFVFFFGILNFTIIDFSIYNINHLEDDEEDEIF